MILTRCTAYTVNNAIADSSAIAFTCWISRPIDLYIRHYIAKLVAKKQKAQLPQTERASNLALSYGAKSISICWTV